MERLEGKVAVITGAGSLHRPLTSCRHARRSGVGYFQASMRSGTWRIWSG